MTNKDLTLQEARKILGHKYKKYPDKLILRLIQELGHLADIALDSIKKSRV